MVQIKEFEVEKWMDENEGDAIHNIAETCCSSITLEELQQLSGADSPLAFLDPKQPMTYGPIRGSVALRTHIAEIYGAAPISADDVLITSGAIHANFLSLYALISPGDHVVCQYPTYQQLYSIPESLGADVTLWKANFSDKWAMSYKDLESAIRPNTKMIILNNPQNPLGTVMTKEELQKIVALARAHDILIHCDEVYWPLVHDEHIQSQVPSITELGYDNVVATGSMSKAYSLAGIRVGWLVSPKKALIDLLASVRHYTTISVSQIDDRIATLAMRPDVRRKILERNIALARKNKACVEALIAEFPSVCEWVTPNAGTTGLIRLRQKSTNGGGFIEDVSFCHNLQRETGTMLVPASHCFGAGKEFVGCVRIGYVCSHEELVRGLAGLRSYLAQYFVD
ncbi:hypothetical protein LTR84_001984 [Exophiala bonariae]|uniref:Aminotransferase class I/classII large domain-containing protein n=1 Tax=Exophiala bonariae TaxID=1690606 RepID=A0AAV9NGM5_9EURO|nr:hypothetical protein LTR84_001984 [Exophiala bonariae]